MSKTIVVTGGSRGIGRAVVLGAGALGWSVGVGYRDDRSAADQVVSAIEAAGGRAVATRGNVAVEEDVVGLFGTTADAFGPLHGAVVNAGIAAPPLPLVETDIARLRRIVDVNVMGALLCAREAARRLAVSLGGGSVVLVSSAASRLGSPHEYVDYAASKGAVDSLALGLAREHAADGVRVNAVRPGRDRDGYARERRPARLCRAARPADPGSAPRPTRGDRRRDPLASRRQRLLHDRRPARRHGWQVEPSVVRKATLPWPRGRSRLLP